MEPSNRTVQYFYSHFIGKSSMLPTERRPEMAGTSGRFTVLETGSREPNALVCVAEERAFFDVGCCYFIVGSLYQSMPDGRQKTVFEASDNVTWKTRTWDIPIPGSLNGD